MGATTIGVSSLYKTSIGKKVIMAITGLIGIGFVFGHMYGNLKVFEFMTGPEYANAREHFNIYAETLRTFGEPVFGYTHLLWVIRIVLLVSVILHVWAAWSLYQESENARPQKYTSHKKIRTNFASLYMRVGGTLIFLFIIFHLMHFTWGIPGAHPDFVPGDAYHNLVTGFESYGYIPAIFYVIVMFVLGLHLYHGTWSLFQTLGLNNKTYTTALRALAWAVAIVVTGGFMIVPLAVMFGLVS